MTTGRFFRVPMVPPGTTTLEILLPQRRSGRGVLLVLHASLCGRCHGSASQHSEVQLGSNVLLQAGQILIVLTLVQESPAHKEQTTLGSYHKISFAALPFHVAQYNTVTCLMSFQEQPANSQRHGS